MKKNKRIFFLSADFGAPSLDKLRKDFNDRFINVGIAEQNLVNVAAGLALEDFIVYAFAIAPFLTMRACEQIRQNLSIFSQINPINVNLVGVGAGLSYDLSGPSHQCLEDMGIMRSMPNLIIFSPSDGELVEKFVDFSIETKKPKYFRFDGKSLPLIYDKVKDLKMEKGFHELSKGKKVCFVSTGYMTHTALKTAEIIRGAGVVDVFILQPANEKALSRALRKYKHVVTLEEGFVNNGGLSAIVSEALRIGGSDIKMKIIGIKDKYVFELGERKRLHELNGLDEKSVARTVAKLIN
jgi:transketolase